MYVSCKHRTSDLSEFFSHENRKYPPSLSENGNLRLPSNKADLEKCLSNHLQSPVEERTASPPTTCTIYDGAFMTQINCPQNNSTFAEYFNLFCKKIVTSGLNSKASRIDLVFDRYFIETIKAVRIKRGDSSRRNVKPQNQVPKVWGHFLKNSQNKEELFEMLAESITKYSSNVLVIATKGSTAISNVRSELDICRISPCDHEEADTRMFLHAHHASQAGHSRVLIRSRDTAVLVLGVHLFEQLDVEELWLAFGVGKHFRFIPIHELHACMNPSLVNGLTFFHAFTGCDSVSSFSGIGKTTAYNKAVKASDPILEAFRLLSAQPEELSEATLAAIELFVIQMYDSSYKKKTDINATRLRLVSRGKTIEKVPPTKEALRQHTKRAAFQAGYVWARSLEKDQHLPSYRQWGWTDDTTNSTVIPLWTVLPPASETCKELIKCKCTGRCNNNCQCKKKELSCTHLCKCEGQCDVEQSVTTHQPMDIEP